MNMLVELQTWMEEMNVDYALCGGIAIDLHIGKPTRPHKDLDVSVSWEDRDALIQFMLDRNWLVFEPCGKDMVHRITDIYVQKKVKRNIFCLKTIDTLCCINLHQVNEDFYQTTDNNHVQTKLDFIEFLFNDLTDKYFLYARNKAIGLERTKAVLHHQGVPYLAPELVLLYKSTLIENLTTQGDFTAVLPFLKKEQVKWLFDALQTAYPSGHPWSKRLHTMEKRKYLKETSDDDKANEKKR